MSATEETTVVPAAQSDVDEAKPQEVAIDVKEDSAENKAEVADAPAPE